MRRCKRRAMERIGVPRRSAAQIGHGDIDRAAGGVRRNLAGADTQDRDRIDFAVDTGNHARARRKVAQPCPGLDDFGVAGEIQLVEQHNVRAQNLLADDIADILVGSKGSHRRRIHERNHAFIAESAAYPAYLRDPRGVGNAARFDDDAVWPVGH